MSRFTDAILGLGRTGLCVVTTFLWLGVSLPAEGQPSESLTVSAVVSGKGEQVADISYKKADDGAEITVFTHMPAHFFALENPSRLVLDIERSLVSTPLQLSLSSTNTALFGLQRIRLGEQPDTVRIVFDVVGETVRFLSSSESATVTVKENKMSSEQTASTNKAAEPVTQLEATRFPVITPRVAILTWGALPVLDVTADSTGVIHPTALKLVPLNPGTPLSPQPLSIAPQPVLPGAHSSQIRIALLSRNAILEEKTYAIEGAIGAVAQTIGFVLLRPVTQRPAMEWELETNTLRISNNGNISAWFCLASTSEQSEIECANPGEGTLLLPGATTSREISPQFAQLLCVNYGETVECHAL